MPSITPSRTSEDGGSNATISAIITTLSRTSPLPRPPGRNALCVRTGRRFNCPLYLGFRRSGLVRELPGTGSKTKHLGAPDTIKVAGFGPLRSPSRTSPTAPFLLRPSARREGWGDTQICDAERHPRHSCAQRCTQVCFRFWPEAGGADRATLLSP
jgi:hypothetical protein